MEYCSKCGNKLTEKESINFGISDGMVPYCINCKEFRFPMFNCAVSAVIFNKDYSKTLLIQQYGRDVNILVAGYVAKSENLETALQREIQEEVGLKIKRFKFNASEYYEKSNSLICNFIAEAKTEDFTLTKEVDLARWYTIEDAKREILQGSLAQRFFLKALDKIKKTSFKQAEFK